jgi:hypothetical protein
MEVLQTSCGQPAILGCPMAALLSVRLGKQQAESTYRNQEDHEQPHPDPNIFESNGWYQPKTA